MPSKPESKKRGILALIPVLLCCFPYPATIHCKRFLYGVALFTLYSINLRHRMKGIWLLTSHLLGSAFHDNYAVARIAIDIIFFCLILFAYSRQPSSTNSASPFKQIIYGTFALLLYVSILLSRRNINRLHAVDIFY